MVSEVPPTTLRIALVIAGLGVWFGTQRLIKYRPSGDGTIGDGLHVLTRPWFEWVRASERRADALLIVSSLGIDLLGLFVLGRAILGPSMAPFVGMLMLFGLRQICQATCALPPPEGIIWRSPGVPSFLVTYDVANDLFFSGHTAMAVFGAIELGRWGGPAWAAVGAAVALFEVTTVLVLRAHYTMDVYAGAITAVLAAITAAWVGPWFDSWLVRAGAAIGLSRCVV
jgi:hypothetical protein